ncbi:hypothetical protein [Thomasclavelia cocleata]|jgi:hypothetical protein|uniref:hypothetical protein n=1 Tax=Thomasclavelia cocleata TaxID=69824 RepID=UPI00242B2253|nr:hypothetical protein [Thomasclavelia cocleata]
MKIVSIKFKKGIKKRIRDTQKLYEFMCPIKDIHVGEHVLLEVCINKRDDFQVGRIEKISDIPEDKTTVLPEGFVVCKLPVKDFDKRCESVRKFKREQISMNKKIEKINK